MDDQSFGSYQRGYQAEETTVGANDGVQQDGVIDTPQQQRTLRYGNLEIRPDEIQALAEGRRVGLTVREFQVLLILAEREDRVLRRADIYSRVWGGEMKYRDRSVDVFVRKVRNKLTRAAPGWTYIHTHFGVGYRFAATPLTPPAEDGSSQPAASSPPAAAVAPEPAGL